MTALEKYDRLEASALWRASQDDQRRDVIVSVGDATLTITDMQDRPLAHWSLPAVKRVNPGVRPAIYFPDGDPGETLEFAGDETAMIEAIEKLRNAIERGRPRPGRLRLATVGMSALSVAALAVFWLPGALLNHTIIALPDVKRTEIGDQLLPHIVRLTGRPCSETYGDIALAKLARRLGQKRLLVVPDGPQRAIALPGGTILLNRALVEDHIDPDVVAGFIVTETARAIQNDPLRIVLENNGITTSFKLLTTGNINDDALRVGAEHLLRQPVHKIPETDLIAAFEVAELRSSPFAYAVDISGETTLPLIEADPFQATPREVLEDGYWVALQNICGG